MGFLQALAQGADFFRHLRVATLPDGVARLLVGWSNGREARGEALLHGANHAGDGVFGALKKLTHSGGHRCAGDGFQSGGKRKDWQEARGRAGPELGNDFVSAQVRKHKIHQHRVGLESW